MCVSRLMTPNEICAVVLSVWLTRLTVKKKNVECCSRDGKYTVHIIHIIRLCARQRAYTCLLRLFVHALRITAARRSLSLLPASVILSHFLRRTLTEFRVSRELSATLPLIIYVKIWQLKDELVRVFHSHFATVQLWPTAKCRCLYIHDTSYMWWIILTSDVAFSFLKNKKGK